VVLVTGATGGVGRGIALACGEVGWTVWIAARRAAEGTAVADEVIARGGKGRFVRCEAGEPDSVRDAIAAAVEEDGALHGAVHNATSGLSPRPGSIGETTLADLRDHVAVSVRGTYLVAREVLPHLEAAGGAMVVLTSEAGFEGKARLPAYAAVKAAQRGLVRALAREWGPKGVRVNALAPLAAGPSIDEAFARDPAMAERVLGRTPMGRLGDATEDIGPVARFLLGPDAAFMTGVTLPVDGGSCSIS
jgi:3-oxoacyl-[acyl-carrier protein] reductase